MDDIEYDSSGCEVRSNESDSEGSLRDFIDDDSDLEDIDETNKLYVPRVRNLPIRFSEQVYETEEEDTSSEESSSDEEG
jgi:hypothetical protein